MVPQAGQACVAPHHPLSWFLNSEATDAVESFCSFSTSPSGFPDGLSVSTHSSWAVVPAASWSDNLGRVRPDELDVVHLAGHQGDVLRLAALTPGRAGSRWTTPDDRIASRRELDGEVA